MTQKKEIEDLTTMKANICYLSDRLDESEQIFLKALKLKGSKRPDLSIYLRLGNLFLKKELTNNILFWTDLVRKLRSFRS